MPSVCARNARGVHIATTLEAQSELPEGQPITIQTSLALAPMIQNDWPLRLTLWGRGKAAQPSNISSNSGSSLFFAPDIGFRKPTMTYNGVFAGRPVYKAGLNCWSKYHQIHQRTGDITNPHTPDLNELYPTNVAPEEKEQFINAAGGLSRAAGKIYIRIAETKCETLSGFWLAQDYFVTAAHFGPHNEPDADEFTKALKSKDCQNAHVSALEESISEDSDSGDTLVHLVARNRSADIAVFVAHFKGRDHSPVHITIDQLHAMAPDTSIASLSIWTAGYCGRNELLKPSDRKLLAGSNTMGQQVRDDPASTKFDLYHQQYMECLEKSMVPADQELWQRITSKGESKVHFEEIFKVHTRALAVGRTQPSSDQPKTDTSMTTVNTGFEIGRMSISGFHGLSGSMICHFLNDDMNKPRVIGIFKGQDPTYPYNQFVGFKPGGVAWIKDRVTELNPEI